MPHHEGPRGETPEGGDAVGCGQESVFWFAWAGMRGAE